MAEDTTNLVEKMLGGVRDLVQRSLQPLADRIKAIEAVAPMKGDKGDPGPEGLPGRDGRDGADGPRGEKGEPGLSIKGDPGEKGRDGRDGKDGSAGKDGAPGLRGADGIGLKGDPGPAGEPGKDGRDGPPGLDALQVEVLEGVDPAKRYQRGTFAAYRGGIVRAYKATAPINDSEDVSRAGWHVVVRGIDEVAAELSEDGRTVGLAIKMTDGVVMKTLKLPTMIYRGIWKEVDAYERGDATTRDGSTWILMVDQQKGKPGDEDSGWVLSTKRGRDGRDGIRGEKGDRGAEGRAGRDLTQIDPQTGQKW